MEEESPWERGDWQKHIWWGCFYKSNYYGSLNLKLAHLASMLSSCEWWWWGAAKVKGASEEGLRLIRVNRGHCYLKYPFKYGVSDALSATLFRERNWSCFPARAWSQRGQSQTNEFTEPVHMVLMIQRPVCEFALTSVLTIPNNCQHFISTLLQGDFHILFHHGSFKAFLQFV